MIRVLKLKLKKNIKYSICSCGLSKKMPVCDNAHRYFNQKNGTNYKSVKLTPDDDITFSIIAST